MTIEKALKGIDIYLDGKKRLAEGLKNEAAKWSDDKLSSLCNTLINAFQTDVEFLSRLKEQLVIPKKSKMKGICKHPKNMRDKAGEIWYCMNCNQDL